MDVDAGCEVEGAYGDDTQRAEEKHRGSLIGPEERQRRNSTVEVPPAVSPDGIGPGELGNRGDREPGTGEPGENQLHRHVASAGGRVRGGTSHGRRCARPTRFRASLRPGGGPARTRFARKHARGPDPRPVLANSSGSPGVLEVGSRDAPPLPRPASFSDRREPPPAADAARQNRKSRPDPVLLDPLALRRGSERGEGCPASDV